jgi:hypothetical protein
MRASCPLGVPRTRWKRGRSSLRNPGSAEHCDRRHGRASAPSRSLATAVWFRTSVTRGHPSRPAALSRSRSTGGWSRQKRPACRRASSNPGRDPRRSIIRVFVLPEPNHGPPGGTKPCVSVGISLLVRLQLRSPPISVRPRRRPMLRAVMPEAAIHEDRKANAWEEDVGTAAHTHEGRAVDPIAQPHPIERRPQCHLRSGVAPPSRFHPPTRLG